MHMSSLKSNITNVSIDPHTCNGLKSVEFIRTPGVIATAIGTSILNVGFGLFAIVANLLAMIVIYRKGSTRIPADIFIASLSLTDFLVGLLVQPFSVILRFHELVDIHLCVLKKAYAFTGYHCCGVSMLTICCFSFDRVLAIGFPYIYDAEASNRKSTMIIVSCWISWFLYTILPFCGVISSKNYYISLSCVITLSVIASVICYIYITSIVRRQLRKISSQLPPVQDPTSESEKEKPKCTTSWLKTQRQRSFTTIIIAFVFILCFIPKVCSMIATVIVGNDLDVLYIGSKWSDTMVFINSSLNPIIYVTRIKEMREDMVVIIQSLKKKLVCNEIE